MKTARESEPSPFLPPEIKDLDWEAYLKAWVWFAKPKGSGTVPKTNPTHERTSDRGSALASKRTLYGRNLTRPVVTTAKAAHSAAADVAGSFHPGKESLFFCKSPGVGGTTAIVRHWVNCLETRAPGYEKGVAVAAFPRRDLAEEKAEITERYARDQDLKVLVLTLLGKSKDADSGWYCAAEQYDRRVRQHRELGRSACVSCSLKAACEETPGHYRYEREQVLLAIARAGRDGNLPVLVFTTHAMVPTLQEQLHKTAPILLDEAGDNFGLTSELDIPWGELDTARRNTEEYIDRQRELGKTVESEQEYWRDWSERAPERRAATEELWDSLSKSNTETDCLDAAIRWAQSCEYSSRRARQLVSRHWPEKTKIKRALTSHASARDTLPELLAADLEVLMLRIIQSLPIPKQVARSKPVSKQQRRKKGKKRRPLKAASPEPPDDLRWLPSQERHLKAGIRKFPEAYLLAMREGKVRPPVIREGFAAWPWENVQEEDGEDLRPAFASLMLRIARRTIEGRAPMVRRQRRVVHIWIPNDDFIRRIDAGYVVWIAVGPMPTQVRDALNVREEFVLAEPFGLEIFVLSWKTESDKWACFGPGVRFKKVKGKCVPFPSMEDEAARAISGEFAALAKAGMLKFCGKPVRSFAAILHQIDWLALDRPDWASYYNGGHAGTDRLADCQMIVVRRWTLPLSECVLKAEILRRALNLPTPKKGCGEVTVETRMWHGGHGAYGETVPTSCLVDPLEYDLQIHYEAQGMANAIGRVRALTAGAEGRIVIFLNGRPLEGIRVTEGPVDIFSGRGTELLGSPLYIPSKESQEKTRRAREESETRRVVERQKALLSLCQQRAESGLPPASLATLARLLDTSPRTVSRDLDELGTLAAEFWEPSQDVEPSIRLAVSLNGLLEGLCSSEGGGAGEVSRGKVSGVRHDSSLFIIGGAPHAGHLACNLLIDNDLQWLPTAADVHKELSNARGKTPEDRTVRRHLAQIKKTLRIAGGKLQVKRSDQRRSLLIVLQACLALLAPEARDQESPEVRIESPMLPFEAPGSEVKSDSKTGPRVEPTDAGPEQQNPESTQMDSCLKPVGAWAETGFSEADQLESAGTTSPIIRWTDGLSAALVEPNGERPAILKLSRIRAELRALAMLFGSASVGVGCG